MNAEGGGGGHLTVKAEVASAAAGMSAEVWCGKLEIKQLSVCERDQQLGPAAIQRRRKADVSHSSTTLDLVVIAANVQTGKGRNR